MTTDQPLPPVVTDTPVMERQEALSRALDSVRFFDERVTDDTLVGRFSETLRREGYEVTRTGSGTPSTERIGLLVGKLQAALADEWDLSYFRRGSRGDYVNPDDQEPYLEVTETDIRTILAALCVDRTGADKGEEQGVAPVLYPGEREGSIDAYPSPETQGDAVKLAGEPIAWMYERNGVKVCTATRCEEYTSPALDFTETPLFVRQSSPPVLDRDAVLEEAASLADQRVQLLLKADADRPQAQHRHRELEASLIAQLIRSLKSSPDIVGEG